MGSRRRTGHAPYTACEEVTEKQVQAENLHGGLMSAGADRGAAPRERRTAQMSFTLP